jgi:hypothetical protein
LKNSSVRPGGLKLRNPLKSYIFKLADCSKGSLLPMKNLVLTLFSCFTLFAAGNTFAGNNTLTANYPASLASYNKVTLTTQGSTNVNCAVASNTGLIFTSGNKLETCANGQTVTFPQTCFNQFCSGLCANPANPCPPGYTQVMQAGVPLKDQFTASTSTPGGPYKVTSFVCCSS